MAKPAALAKEGRTLPPRESWQTIVLAHERIRLRAPPGIFAPRRSGSDSHLVSKLKAAGLGENPIDHVFSLEFRRVGRSIDALLADAKPGSPLHDVHLDDAFPKHTADSFKEKKQEPIGSGFSARTIVADKPAYVWVTGAEGYNTDHVLVRIGDRDTLVVSSDWSSSIMEDQPECYQRAIIAGIMDSVAIE